MLVPISLRFVDAVDAFLVLQKSIRSHHPGLPWRLHILGYDASRKVWCGCLRPVMNKDKAGPKQDRIVNVSARGRSAMFQLACTERLILRRKVASVFGFF